MSELKKILEDCKQKYGEEFMKAVFELAIDLPRCCEQKNREIKHKELNEEDAVRYFEELYKAFIYFLSNNDVLTDDKFRENHFDTLKERSNIDPDVDECPLDYYFEYLDKKYSLDIYDDYESCNFDPDYFDFSEDIVICELYQEREYYGDTTPRLSVTFAYDKKAKKCVELISLCRNSFANINPIVVRSIEDEQAFGRVLKRVTENNGEVL